MLDHKKLAVIHIVKRDLGLSDEAYRALLREAAGVESARDLDEPGFRRLMRRFVRSRHYRAGPGAMTLRQKWFVQDLLAALGWSEDHVHNFLRKYYHVDGVEAMSRRDAGHLIESLKNVRAHGAGRDVPDVRGG